ncbi:hypothetical protein L2E82_16460 [Cichorium intybus]|uniref:Uncharacterized protein n=1 Tax=Cichorium intybus TaxID=13427 RepID=A0ACB9F4Y5_CICIN|nr:hypothetical protein L2E82_16460 [Cichorium intybus]
MVDKQKGDANSIPIYSVGAFVATPIATLQGLAPITPSLPIFTNLESTLTTQSRTTINQYRNIALPSAIHSINATAGGIFDGVTLKEQVIMDTFFIHQNIQAMFLAEQYDTLQGSTTNPIKQASNNPLEVINYSFLEMKTNFENITVPEAMPHPIVTLSK